MDSKMCECAHVDGRHNSQTGVCLELNCTCSEFKVVAMCECAHRMVTHKEMPVLDPETKEQIGTTRGACMGTVQKAFAGTDSEPKTMTQPCDCQGYKRA